MTSKIKTAHKLQQKTLYFLIIWCEYTVFVFINCIFFALQHTYDDYDNETNIYYTTMTINMYFMI
jgi:hypothetical protein